MSVATKCRSCGGRGLLPFLSLGQMPLTDAYVPLERADQPEPRYPLEVAFCPGCTLVQRWHNDVPWATPIWRATQLLSLYQVMDRPGPITKDKQALAAGYPWGVDKPLGADELSKALARLAELQGAPSAADNGSTTGPVTWAQLKSELAKRNPKWSSAIEDAATPADPNQVKAGEFALVAAKILAP